MKINQWKETNRKRARDAGNPYISKRKKPVPGKLPPEMGRQCSCKFQCGQLNHEEILQHFKNFHGLSYNSQTAFLANSCIKVVDINRHTVSEDISKRHCTVEYYLPRTDSNIRICQKAICHIFKITPRRIQMLVDKIKFNTPLSDCRGSHGKHGHVSEETKELIKQHIHGETANQNVWIRH
ncbi:hypothetical protein J6590_006911 [Homalodisca vitripennis]|nr:hypothetical protein J6590_006911 [Homalodisca vitripennis]